MRKNLNETINSIKDNAKEETIKNAIPILEKVVSEEYWNLNAEEKNKLLKSIVDKIEFTKDKPNNSWEVIYNTANKFDLKIYMKI